MDSATVDITKSKYYFYIGVLFVAILMISETTAVKLIQAGPFVVTGAIIMFPISYIFGDILTEVYGYRATRKIVWSGFGAVVLMSFCYWLVQLLPAASFWQNQGAYEAILGAVPRITLASLLAYFAGEFSNSYVMSRMKVWTNGRHLWTRTVGSTVVGEGIDSIIFAIVAFYGTVPGSVLFALIWSIYVLKVAYEVIVTPLTYLVVAWLKRAEGIDVYDRGISYNPFHLSETV